MSKHIVNIVPAFIEGDGIGNAARARVKGLLERGYRVSLICATASGGIAGFPQLKLMQAGGGWEADSSSLTSEMFAAVRSADVLFVEFGCFNICHELLVSASAPLILFYQGITPAALMQNDMYTSCYWRAIGELRKMPVPERVLAASQFTLDEYQLLTGRVIRSSRVVPLFGNTEQIQDDPQHYPRHGRRPFQVLTVGQMFPHKNYEVLIEASRMLLASGIDLRVQHIGGASDLIALNYRQALQKSAEPLGERFQFLGRVNQKRLDQAYAQADVVVIPSLHEGYSLPAREALIHGKPVIASHFGALPETLEGAARFFHPLDASELAKHIQSIANLSEREWQDTCRSARAVAANHSVDRYVNECVEEIECAIAQRTATCESMRGGQVALGQSEDSAESQTKQYFHEAYDNPAGILAGRIRLPAKLIENLQDLGLVALITTRRHVLQSRLSVQTEWSFEDESAICNYSISMQEFAHWTEASFFFIESSSGNRRWNLGGFQRLQKESNQSSHANVELNRLAIAIRDVYSPKSIVAADHKLLTRIKTKVANTILKLVYQVFIGPQMAVMQSQFNLLATEVRQLKTELAPFRDVGLNQLDSQNANLLSEKDSET